MYKQEVQHKIKFELINDRPKITIGVRFNDLFTQDTYMFISENTKNFNKNNIKFDFLINNKKEGSYTLYDLNFENFFVECFSTINDYDFKDLFNDKKQQEISEQINENLSQYERNILLNEISYEGEIRRMKELSGLKRKFLS